MTRDTTPAPADPPDGIRPFVVSAWSELLGADRLTDHSHFRARGGDSLTGLRLARRIGLRYGVQVTPGDLLCRTLGEHVALIGARTAAAGPAAVPPGAAAGKAAAPDSATGPASGPGSPGGPGGPAEGAVSGGPGGPGGEVGAGKADVRAWLTTAWASLLHRPETELADGADFFALGGTSLLATRLSCRIGRRLGVAVPVQDLLAAPTLREQAALVRRLLGRARAV